MTMPKQLQPWAFKSQERAVAKAAGETMYFTGRPCKHGHIANRCTANGCCIECSKKTQKETIRRRISKNPDYYKQRYALDPEKYKAFSANYRLNNPDVVKANNANSIKNRKPQRAALEMMRNARKLQATPKWLSKTDIELIGHYYKAARQQKITLAVDHIVPLRGKDVCGLHVPWNLCLRTKSDNSRKHNKLTDEAYLPKQVGILVAESALPWNI